MLALLSVAALAGARDKPEEWTEVRSQHFIVATNASEKQARHIADQFERMRSVFHAAFPRLEIDPGTPIIVLAVKDEKSFRALEPEAYLAKGQLKLGGLFLRAPDKNYVLMRLDAEGDHPYAVIYHEYTHLLLSKSAEWLPLWMNEGLAQFYENTEIRDKEVALGEPSAGNLMLLRQNRLLPLPTLFMVDAKSPYYHEENKGSIFYAESWALVHYLQVQGRHDKVDRLAHYSDLLIKGTDPVAAAANAFGDLKQLQSALEAYVQQASFHYFKIAAATEVDESTFKVDVMTPGQSDALRADFLAYNERTADARSLLDRALQEDPNNASAHETMGLLEFREGHRDEAKKWYAQAVQLDSQSYLAHYYFAAMSMEGAMASSDDAKVENSLRTAIKLNPSFAPAYDRLNVFLATRHADFDEARLMGLRAIGLDPANVGYRINIANVFLQMQQAQNAIVVLQAAAKLAKTPGESLAVENMLMHAQLYSSELDRMREAKENATDESAGQVSTEETVVSTAPRLAHRAPFVPSGPHRFLTGTLKNVHCHLPEMDLTVNSTGKSLPLHSDNSYKIDFTTLGFQIGGTLNPCKDLEGRPAKVEYVESANKSVTAQVLSIELHK